MKNIVKLIILLSFITDTARGNVTSYSFTQAYSIYNNISGNTAIAAGWNSNSSSSAIPIGFNFNYNNVVYTNLWITGNGCIYFNNPTGPTAYALTSGANLIAGLNAPLYDITNTPVTYITLGAAGNRTFIAQWDRCGAATGDTFSFQIRLTETSNAIEVCYGNCAKHSGSEICQVGLSCNTDMQGRTTVVNWSNTAGSFFDSTTCTLSPNNTPYEGLVFEWLTQAQLLGSSQFALSTNTACSGPVIDVYSNVYAPNENVTIAYGDGTISSAILSPQGTQGHANIAHFYLNTGTYTIKAKYFIGLTLYDSLHYTYEYSHCNTIHIKYYYDVNNNCIDDAGENAAVIPVLTEVDSNGIPIDTISSTGSFYYDAHGNYGDVYNFKLLANPYYQIICPVSGVVSYTMANINYVPDISVGAACNNNAFDLSEYLVIPTTGIHDQIGNIYIQNATCLSTNATVTLNFSNKFGGPNWNAQPAPTSSTATSLTWDIASLNSTYTNPNPMHLHYQVWNAPLLGLLVIGDTVNSYAEIDPIAGDINTGNNSTSTTDTVRGGCDPNEMWVAPTGHIYAGTQLKYTINFENTGNDTTYNVYVMDTLSDNVNARSVRLVAASNAMNVSYLTANGHNIVRFDFPNINLLDSSHHGQCDGMVIFNVNAKEGLPDGTTIFNHAEVFFDNNPVVITDTVENIIGQPEKVNNITANTISIYPNPASTTLTINTGNAQCTSYTITNSLGQVITEQPLTTKMAKADISSLAAGIYYITLKDDNGTVVKKFVKM